MDFPYDHFGLHYRSIFSESYRSIFSETLSVGDIKGDIMLCEYLREREILFNIEAKVIVSLFVISEHVVCPSFISREPFCTKLG